jgi:hypothetical protein
MFDKLTKRQLAKLTDMMLESFAQITTARKNAIAAATTMRTTTDRMAAWDVSDALVGVRYDVAAILRDLEAATS